MFFLLFQINAVPLNFIIKQIILKKIMVSTNILSSTSVFNIDNKKLIIKKNSVSEEM